MPINYHKLRKLAFGAPQNDRRFKKKNISNFELPTSISSNKQKFFNMVFDLMKYFSVQI